MLGLGLGLGLGLDIGKSIKTLKKKERSVQGMDGMLRVKELHNNVGYASLPSAFFL